MTDGEPVRRGIGRPRKHPIKSPDQKRPRGRPRKDQTAIKAADQIFDHKYKSIQDAALDLLPEYPGMARAAAMSKKDRRLEPAFEKLADKIRLEIKKRLVRVTPEQKIHFPLDVFRVIAPISKRRLRQEGPKAEEMRQSRHELREIVEWLDEREAHRQKTAKSKK